MKSAAVYDLGTKFTERFGELQAQLEEHEGTTDEQVIAVLFDRIQQLEDSAAERVDAVLCIAAEYRARAAGKHKEVARLEARAKIEEAAADRIESVVVRILDAVGVKNMDTERFHVVVRPNGGKVPLKRAPTAKVEDLPDDCVKTKRDFDNDVIRTRLEAGLEVPGFTLGARGRHLVIS